VRAGGFHHRFFQRTSDESMGEPHARPH
jgi:hypothetical protein